ncbi:sensor histidine kinase [Nocardia mexicana]|uniref:sensor histidine kinase n=1 Tax=Nocardia mexicana TaxID=279262 RepID=UPI0008358C10|nr:histidine kinase [Nocardia mexicana]
MGNWVRSASTGYGRYVLIGALTLVAVQNSATSAGGDYVAPRCAAALLCGVALLVPRCPWPITLGATTVTTALWGWPMLSLLLVALFDTAAAGYLAVAGAATVVAMGGNLLTHPPTSLWAPQQYGALPFVLLAMVCGLWVGNRRRLLAALAAQVEQLRVERELREQAARTAERSAIAAEMHDVLAHRLSLIALHAGVLTTTRDLPGPVAERLGLLRTSATAALGDLRDVLGALRDPESGSSATVPAPPLPGIEDLLDQARAVGQRIELTAEGDAEQAPAGHRLAVFRLVQEALTNARKHAPGASARVRIDYGRAATVVEVVNATGSRAAPANGCGFGLVGLRERVTALGGELTAGPGDTGTWLLTARIPHPDPSGTNGIRP